MPKKKITDAEHPNATFSDFIRPFAEKLVLNTGMQEPGQASEAVETLAGAIEAWVCNVVAYTIEIKSTTFARIRRFAALLDRELMPFNFKYGKELGPDGNIAVVPSREQLFALVNKDNDIARAQALAGGLYLNTLLLLETPPLIDVDGMRAILNKIVEGTTAPARPKGKPYGIQKYPKLDLLAYDLCRCAEIYFTMPLTAYVKIGEQRVAAGSLIVALDALREYLAAANQCVWLAAYLPTMTEQPACVATYNRIIAEARDAVWSEREGTTASSPQ